MSFYVEMIVVFAIVLVVALIIAAVTKYRKFIMDQIIDFKNKFFWQGFIASMRVSSLQKLMTVGIQIRLWMKASEA